MSAEGDLYDEACEGMPEKRCDLFRGEAHTAHVWIDKDGMPKLCQTVRPT